MAGPSGSWPNGRYTMGVQGFGQLLQLGPVATPTARWSGRYAAH